MKHLPVKPTVDIAALDALDIRVGTILRVEDVENSDKLVKLRVDFGEFQRTILVGMKLHAALHACTTMNENQVQQTRQHDKI